MLLSKNKKALFNFEVLDKYIAGIALKGHEVKAIKEGNVHFEGSYISFVEDILTLVNLNIGRYSKQSQESDDSTARRPRELLLTKTELSEIRRHLQEKGKTAVPLALVLLHGKIKLELAVAKGKKLFEKKQSVKEKQIKRDLDLSKKYLLGRV